MIKKFFLGAIFMALSLSGVSYAQSVNSTQVQVGTKSVAHKPRQESVDACSGKSVGNMCSYQTKRGTIRSGICYDSTVYKFLYCRTTKMENSAKSSAVHSTN